MALVKLSGTLRSAAGGLTELEIDAPNIHQLLLKLAEQHPKLKPVLDRGVSVAVDGEIYRDDRFRPLPAGSEVFILPRMAGG
ncbi:MAG: MoaD/ThiS family protein [Alphaproteobacteria bacterium]|nr:MoaD/ThiS family protein [Alphaproteobacteria bacterium]